MWIYINLAWAEGQTMTLDDAVAYALVNPEATTDGSAVMSMTRDYLPSTVLRTV